MSIPKTTIIIPTWNSKKYLPFCFNSIFEQTNKDFSIAVIDNGSTDGSVEFIKENYPKTLVIQNSKNLGFAHAINQGIKMSKGEYVLLCNTDIILEPNFLEQALATIKKDQKIASVGGKLLKAKWSPDELPKPIKTDIIDSLGILISKSHKTEEINKETRGEQEKEVFGISGALVLLRKSALEDIKYKEEYFDESFFSYKEDVDLAWRLKLAGYKAVINPKAIAYHFRGVSQEDERKNRPKLINQLSYKNNLLTIIKNQTLANLIIYSPHILARELAKLIYFLILEQSTLKVIPKFINQLPNALNKRKHILSNKKNSNKQIRRWFK